MYKAFILRWGVSSLGLWVASSLLGPTRLMLEHKLSTVIGAGFFLAVVNIFVRPLLIFLSLPALLLSLGLFMIIINGLVVLIVSRIYDPLHVSGLGAAVVAGIIIGLVNILVSKVLKDVK